MIISASRRTDIPAFYSTWFFNRIKERYVLVPNPYNSKMISRINLDPAIIDCIVFWTKNPAPILPQLYKLNNYKYYFQFTLNPYGKEIENNLPALARRIDAFKHLSDKIGKDKVIWRYDPIFTNETYPINFHLEKFAEIAYSLKGHTEKCTLGFLDYYPHIRTTVSKFNIQPIVKKDIDKIALSFKETIENCSILLDTCTEKVNLSHLGIQSGACIDNKLVEKITGYPILTQKDKNQRSICHCAESIDIGTYESCLNGCIYCYAIKGNYNTAKRNLNKHDKNSPILIGQINEGDIIKERPMKSLRTNQFPLF